MHHNWLKEQLQTILLHQVFRLICGAKLIFEGCAFAARQVTPTAEPYWGLVCLIRKQGWWMKFPDIFNMKLLRCQLLMRKVSLKSWRLQGLLMDDPNYSDSVATWNIFSYLISLLLSTYLGLNRHWVLSLAGFMINRMWTIVVYFAPKRLVCNCLGHT